MANKTIVIKPPKYNEHVQKRIGIGRQGRGWRQLIKSQWQFFKLMIQTVREGIIFGFWKKKKINTIPKA